MQHSSKLQDDQVAVEELAERPPEDTAVPVPIGEAISGSPGPALVVCRD